MNEDQASQFGMQYVDLHETKIDESLFGVFSAQDLSERGAVPYAESGDSILVAVGDPYDLDLAAELSLAAGRSVQPVLADPQEISKALKHRFGVGSVALNDEQDESDSAVDDFADGAELDDLGEQRTVSKLVSELLEDALQQGASDVHLENEEGVFQVRYRVDGLLRAVHFPPKMSQFRSAIISRIKILAKLNIAERRLPQDGRFKTRLLNRETDIRVSVIPMLHGENVVLRLLDRGREVLSISDLEIPDTQEKQFLNMIKRPNGMILITGPTGSGKTTTLYSALNAIRDQTIKIVTIEDPVEYSLPGIHQIQVHEKIGRTFANGLRSILRHDPDVVLVGEIRDRETAQSAVQASLTGHLVLSTLHTNDACGAVSRLVDMGVEPFLVASTLRGVMAQRLVRRLCPHCKEEVSAESLAIPEDYPDPSGTVCIPKGCRHCHQLGYRGRLPIFELLTFDESVRQMAAQGSDTTTLRQYATSLGMRSLRDCGWQAVMEGKTPVDEILSLTGIASDTTGG
ncbi:MAG: GspE/PulE family protein [Rubripirellula sp.]